MLKIETFPRFELENGQILTDVPVAYHTWGRLNSARDNVIVVCHALTGNTDVSDWWEPLLGPGRAFDDERYFVICMNVLGSPYGSASPVTRNRATGRRYGGDFPKASIRDTVALHRRLLDRLGVRQVAFAVGGSMGGMQALEWAYEGDFVRAIAPIAVGGRHAAWQISFSEAQRQTIYADSRWRAGHYPEDDPPRAGLAAARMQAMLSYRSRESFESRFGRSKTEDSWRDAPFAAEGYLQYQGDKFVRRFDAACYVHLTRQMDSHDLSRDRGSYPDALRSIEQEALIVGIDSDVLYPLKEQEELAAHLPKAELAVLSSSHGHDAFLIETEKLNELLVDWAGQLDQPTHCVPHAVPGT